MNTDGTPPGFTGYVNRVVDEQVREDLRRLAKRHLSASFAANNRGDTERAHAEFRRAEAVAASINEN